MTALAPPPGARVTSAPLALRFNFNLAMTENHALQMARAINKVDRALA